MTSNQVVPTAAILRDGTQYPPHVRINHESSRKVGRVLGFQRIRHVVTFHRAIEVVKDGRHVGAVAESCNPQCRPALQYMGPTRSCLNPCLPKEGVGNGVSVVNTRTLLARTHSCFCGVKHVKPRECEQSSGRSDAREIERLLVKERLTPISQRSPRPDRTQARSTATEGNITRGGIVRLSTPGGTSPKYHAAAILLLQ